MIANKKQNKQNAGFIDVHLILIVGLISGVVLFAGYKVYDSQSQSQTNSQSKNSSSGVSENKKALSLAEQEKLAAAQKKSTVAGTDSPSLQKPPAEVTKPGSTTSVPKTSVTTTKPPTTTPPPTPTWNIVHPSASTCGQGEFTIYSSIAGGTPYYNYYNRGAIVQGTISYKSSKVVRCENSGFGPYNGAPGGPTGEWLEFGSVGVDGGEKYINLNDVSTTAPPN